MHLEQQDKRVKLEPLLQRWKVYLVPVTEGFLKSDELGDGSATPHSTCVLQLRADGTNENFFEHL